MITEKVNAVKKLYGSLDRHLSAFKRRSGVQCASGCGECCMKENLHATVLEFLPAAYTLYLDHSCDQVLEKIGVENDPVCVFYNPFGEAGKCAVYNDRGLICRLFGFSGRTSKTGDRSFITCSVIRDTLKEKNPGPVLDLAPDMSSYYLRLYGIDTDLSIRYMPVNQAVKQAIELVAFDSGYRKRPA